MWSPTGQGVAGWYSLHPLLPFSTFRRGRANTLVAAAQPYAELGINEVTSSNRGRKMSEFLQHANEITGQEGISELKEGTGQHYQDNSLCERFGYSIQGCLLICGINQMRLTTGFQNTANSKKGKKCTLRNWGPATLLHQLWRLQLPNSLD